jgi:prolyl oligopeptidase
LHKSRSRLDIGYYNQSVKNCVAILALMTIPLNAARLQYPVAPTSEQTDDYHGVKVADPYRPLENPDGEATQKWVAAENELTRSYLDHVPGRDGIKDRLTALWDYERYAGLSKAGSQYFLFHNSGLQNQNVLYVLDSMRGERRVLLDPNTLTKDGAAALTGTSVSWDGKRIGYAIAVAGSDWSDWRIRDIATGKDLPDVIRWTKLTNAAWTKDDASFFYTRFPEPAPDKLLTAENKNARVYLHKLGDQQSADRLIYERSDHPDWEFGPQVTEDGRYLILYVSYGDSAKNLLFVQDLTAAKPVTREVISQWQAAYTVIGNDGSKLYVQTTDGAPRGRVVSIDLDHPEREHWKEIVPQREETLENALLASGKLVLAYLKDAHAAARIVSLDRRESKEIPMPGLGAAHWSRPRQSDHELFFTWTSFLAPTAEYRFDLNTGKLEPVFSSKLKFDPTRYGTKQVFFHSKDGTRVPMFLSYRKGIKLDGRNPTLLYGYGGFNIAITPAFSVPYLEWMDMGGIFAVANLRGGAEYGEEWHQAGAKGNKQNVFDDFIAAAEWLIANHYTSNKKLSIFGGSNGGLLVGAVMNQRPELFGAAMAAVGVMDMLRFDKFTVGATWVGDYGSPGNADDFRVLRTYSPLHNIRKGAEYPPVLITTSDHDDRVVPGHSFKYAAALQAAQKGPAPVLIRIETRAGHGAGKPTSKMIDEWVDRLSFLKKELNITP